MKKLIFIFAVLCSIGAKSQCSNTGMEAWFVDRQGYAHGIPAYNYEMKPDSLYMGDTITVGFVLVVNSDTSCYASVILRNQGYCGGSIIWEEHITDVPRNYPVWDSITRPGDTMKFYYILFVIPRGLCDSNHWQYLDASSFYFPVDSISVFIKGHLPDTNHVGAGISMIHNGNSKVKEVRYYYVTGQLYGIYPKPQTNLPLIPLIEETIYTDSEVSTRKLIQLTTK